MSLLLATPVVRFHNLYVGLPGSVMWDPLIAMAIRTGHRMSRGGFSDGYVLVLPAREDDKEAGARGSVLDQSC